MALFDFLKQKKQQKVRFTLSGWSFREWLKGNWTSIVETLKLGGSIALSYLLSISFFQDNDALIPLVTLLGTLAGKLVLDILHYYVSKQE